MAAYDLNPKPGVPCTCGPRLRCTHGQLAPRDPREVAPDPVGTIPAEHRRRPATDHTNTEGLQNV
jgi:hypothetical protein